MTSIAMIFVINLSNAEVRDRDYFFSQAYNLWTFWMAVGSIGVYSYFKKSFKKFSGVILLVLFILPAINLFSQFHEHDRSHEFLSLDYGLNILNSLEKNAIVFTNGDNDTFPLWYEQAVKDPNCKEFSYPETNVKVIAMETDGSEELPNTEDKVSDVIPNATSFADEESVKDLIPTATKF